MPSRLQLRRYVQRLLAGPFSTADLRPLLTELRFLSGNLQPIRELGHFLAHSLERDQGLAVDEAAGAFDSLSVQLELIEGKNISTDDMPPEMMVMARRNLKLVDPIELKRETGLTKKNGAMLLDRLEPRIRQKLDGRLEIFSSYVYLEEISLVQFLMRRFIPRPMFTGQSLYSAFVEALQKNGLLHHDERHVIKKLRTPIALFAAASMHQTDIKLRNGKIAHMEAVCNPPESPTAGIGVHVSIAGLYRPRKEAKVAYSIYTTGIPLEKATDIRLPVGDPVFSEPLTLNEAGKLVVL